MPETMLYMTRPLVAFLSSTHLARSAAHLPAGPIPLVPTPDSQPCWPWGQRWKSKAGQHTDSTGAPALPASSLAAQFQNTNPSKQRGPSHSHPAPVLLLWGPRESGVGELGPAEQSRLGLCAWLRSGQDLKVCSLQHILRSFSEKEGPHYLLWWLSPEGL